MGDFIIFGDEKLPKLRLFTVKLFVSGIFIPIDDNLVFNQPI